MNYVPNQACIRAAHKAAGENTLTEQEILDAFQKVADYKARLEKAGMITGKDAKIRRFAIEEGERTKLAAAIAHKQAALNIIIREKAMENIGNLMRAGLTPQQSLLAMLEGSIRGVEGARKSVAAERAAFEQIYLGGMMAEIQKEKPHLVGLMDDAALDGDVLTEMMELRDGGAPGSTGNSDAQFLAKTFAKWSELMRTDLNRLGASIGKLDGWAGVQMHDPLKMMKVDAETWAASIMRFLDIERTFPDAPSETEALDQLVSIYNTIITGISPTISNAERGVRVSPANMANQLGKHRVLHFKDAKATLAYREEFGYSNTIAGMYSHLRNGARVGANMTVFGPNPEVMFTSIAAELGRRIRGSKTLTGEEKVRLTKGLQTDAGSMRHALDIATGTASIPVNAKWHEIGTGIRMFQAIAKLGGAVISSISDPITFSAAAQFRGSSFFGTFSDQMSMVLAGRPKGEAAELTFLTGEGFDGITSNVTSQFAATDSPMGRMGRLQELFFRMNGLTWWTDVQRGAAGRVIAAEMGMRAKSSFGDLPEAYSHVLGLHGIDETRWELIRKANLRQVNGVDYVTVDRIAEIPLNEFETIAQGRLEALNRKRPASMEEWQRRRTRILEDARTSLMHDVARFSADEVNFGIIETDARSRRTSTLGTRPGTLAGEALRFIMQFKGWPIAFTQRLLGRQIYGRRAGSWNPNSSTFWSETMPHIGTLLAGLTLAGYAAMTAKDALKGYSPRDPSDMRTWMAALQQGGAWGIYGDFLFSSNNRFGGGLVETLAGPTLGTVGDLWNISADARDAAISGGEDTFSTSKAFSSLWANVPGANLFYVKPALDFLFLNSLRETLSPGYLRSQSRKRQKEFGQERLFPAALGR